MTATLTTQLNDRQEHGLKLVTSGLRRIEEGLKILIDEEGMSVPQVHKHLINLKYEELSLHQLKRIATTMRKAGELNAAPKRGIHASPVQRKSALKAVENSKPEESVNNSHNTQSSTSVQERRSQSWTQPCSLTTTRTSNAITPDVVQSEEECISVMSPDDTEACSDWERASQLLTDLEGFTHKYFSDHHRIGEEQWEDFAIRCRKLAYFADMRYANLRKANEQQAHEIVGAIFPDTAESA